MDKCVGCGQHAVQLACCLGTRGGDAPEPSYEPGAIIDEKRTSAFVGVTNHLFDKEGDQAVGNCKYCKIPVSFFTSCQRRY